MINNLIKINIFYNTSTDVHRKDWNLNQKILWAKDVKGRQQIKLYQTNFSFLIKH